MLIDFHTHCFPDRIAQRAITQLSGTCGMVPFTDGTAQGLLALMRQQGVDRSVVLSIATNAHQQHSVNDFAAALNQMPGLTAFGSVFPDAPDALDELERIAQLGLKGVKLHPDFQGFFVDEERMRPIYRKISQLGLITLFHAGMDFSFEPPYHATPDRLRRALGWFDSPVVAAHWGGLGFAEQVIDRLCGMEQLYLDTSFGYGTGAIPLYRRILEKHGAERILFGSDCPWHSPEMERRVLDTLRLSDTEREAICAGNALRLLKETR